MTSHIYPVRLYVGIWAVLIVLTATTVVVAEVELGEWNVVVALAIAIIKAVLVVLFFMHVKDSSGLTKLIIGAGFFWMAILFGLTLNDYLSRNWSALGRWL
jgi:cytochrome c oxidase subunit IV